MIQKVLSCISGADMYKLPMLHLVLTGDGYQDRCTERVEHRMLRNTPISTACVHTHTRKRMALLCLQTLYFSKHTHRAVLDGAHTVSHRPHTQVLRFGYQKALTHDHGKKDAVPASACLC